MDNILEKLYADFSHRYSGILEANEKAQKVYGALLNQRNCAKSKMLSDLLSLEIIAYNEMNNAFNKYMAVQVEFTTNYNNRLEQALMTNVTTDIDKHEELYALNNILPINNSCDLYLKAVSRESKDWTPIKQMLIELGADITVGNIPGISNIKALVDAAIQIKNIVKEYKDDGTDYFDVDKELRNIEIHIELMRNATSLFLYQTEVLNNETGNNA